MMRSVSSIIVLLWVGSSSFAAEISNVHFADTVYVEKTKLHLRGMALLKWAVFIDVYVGALYLPEELSGHSWPEDIPKRLELSYFRQIEGAGFAETSISLLKDNLPNQDFQSIEKRLIEFCALFKDVKPGDRYSISYSPKGKTELRLNGQLLGGVPGADFAAAYFGIWLGNNPINDSFRDRLLKN